MLDSKSLFEQNLFTIKKNHNSFAAKTDLLFTAISRLGFVVKLTLEHAILQLRNQILVDNSARSPTPPCNLSSASCMIYQAAPPLAFWFGEAARNALLEDIAYNLLIGASEEKRNKVLGNANHAALNARGAVWKSSIAARWIKPRRQLQGTHAHAAARREQSRLHLSQYLTLWLAIFC
jgi:hypothetical protein